MVDMEYSFMFMFHMVSIMAIIRNYIHKHNYTRWSFESPHTDTITAIDPVIQQSNHPMIHRFNNQVVSNIHWANYSHWIQ